MMASYLPQPLRPAFYALHLFDMELTKISENAREPSLGTGRSIQHRESSTSGEKPSTASTLDRNLSRSPYAYLCITRCITTL